jgi:ATP-dependent Clp protease adaptor protein ClpS
MTQLTDKPTEPPKPFKPQVQPPGDDGNDGTIVLERRTAAVKPPQMYQVALMNDDYTPMEFVVYVIQEFFGKDQDTAVGIMLKIHIEGKGICGVFSKDIAATKVNLVMEAAQKAGHPLQAVSEPIDI